MLALARRIPAMDATVRAGGWRGPHDRLVQLEGKTLGIVGLGAIGRRVAELGRAFGMRLLVFTWDADQGRAASVGAEAAPIEQLLRESDVVSLHLRLTAESRGFLDRDRLALMKPTAFLINTARGALVDHDALVDILRAERIAGAGLDVFHEEPVPAGAPILELPNVVLTPHNAGTTPEVVETGLERAVENVERFLRTESAR
jgi:phosphoglycerate dehydrogenase-like enzyme